jgi:hypothetical protein
MQLKGMPARQKARLRHTLGWGPILDVSTATAAFCLLSVSPATLYDESLTDEAAVKFDSAAA